VGSAPRPGDPKGGCTPIAPLVAVGAGVVGPVSGRVVVVADGPVVVGVVDGPVVDVVDDVGAGLVVLVGLV
jgi:hypothetical protein